MYVERTHYYAKPGLRDDVLQTRRDASEVRRRIGLDPGTIHVAGDGAEEGPDVQWECSFASRRANDDDMKARAESAEFEAIRARMRTLVRRFERHLLCRDQPGGEAHWAGDVALKDVPIVPREARFPSAGRELAGYLYLPPGEGPFPCMVANHGSELSQGSTDICKPSLASALMSWGVACFFPHRRGYGNSPGTPWREDVPGEFGSDAYDRQICTRLDAESEDVVAAWQYLTALPEIRSDRIGVMGSSFGGINTLLAASKCPDFRCAVEFAGAAMNWERTPALRALMHQAASRLTQPIYFIQAANDYSVGPTEELASGLAGTDKVVQARVYPGFGITKDEGHLFERHGMLVWGPDVRRFLERWL